MHNYLAGISITRYSRKIVRDRRSSPCRGLRQTVKMKMVLLLMINPLAMTVMIAVI